MSKSTIKPENLEQFQGNFSDDQFWTKLKDMALKAGSKVVYIALQLYYVLKSEDVLISDKALILGALGYFILPVDLIPDFIPGLGFADDLAALTFVYLKIKSVITPEIREQAKLKAEEWFGKNFAIDFEEEK